MPADASAPPYDERDNDSLFGSPPPSPGRGRSSSPLALPSGEGARENVGTLALPGSHIFNELPSAPPPMMHESGINPLHQQHPQQCSWHPPPVPPVLQPPLDTSCHVSSRGTSRSSTPVTASRPSRAPRKPTTKRTSNRSEASSNASTPRPTPPPIALPNASEPPPSNFLRNQQALLGLAGLVGGVNPANLALPRGSSANNPIVLDDESDTPTIGRRPPQSHYAMNTPPLVYPAVVPVPSSEDIIHTLIKQKNIFPVVGALLSLISRTSEGQTLWSQYRSSPAGFHRPYVNGPDYVPPAKRRKVNEVPAGAGDWDVPYPFPIGEGPSNYRTNWERHRSKQLIEDLIGLVKSAAKKAAAKNYYKHPPVPSVMHSEPGKVFRHYRPETLRYGLEPGQALPMQPPQPSQVVPEPTPTGSAKSLPSLPSSLSPTHTPVNSSTSAIPSIDELLAAMMTAPIKGQTPSIDTQNDIAPPASASALSSSSTPSLIPPAWSSSLNSASSASSTSQAPSNDIHSDMQSNIGDFMAMLENLPESELSGLFTSSGDTFSPASTSFHTPASTGTPTSESSCTDMQMFDLNQPIAEGGPSGIDLSDPFLASIDPVLLGFSPSAASGSVNLASQHSMPLNMDEEKGRSTSAGPPPTPTLVGSPLSLDHDEHDPPTPTWNCAFPEPEIVSAGGAGGSGEGAAEMSAAMSTVNVGEMRRNEGGGHEGEKKDKGKGKEREVSLSAFAGYGFTGLADFTPGADVVMRDRPPQPSPYGPLPSRTDGHANVDITAYHAATPPAPVYTQSLAPYTHPNPCTSTASASTSSAPTPTESPLPFPLSIAIPILQATQTQQATTTTPTPSTQSQYKKRKHETLQRARAMRAQLVAEIQRAKVELWETAMEGGCLGVLGKELAKGEEGKEKT